MHSNIVFSNGLLDPWHGGGVMRDISDTLVSLVIPEVGSRGNPSSEGELQGIECVSTAEAADS